MVLVFKNSCEAVCVFNTLCECVVMQSISSKEYKSINAGMCSSHAYFPCRHLVTEQAQHWEVDLWGPEGMRSEWRCLWSWWRWWRGGSWRGWSFTWFRFSCFLLRYTGAKTTGLHKEPDRSPCLSWDRCQMNLLPLYRCHSNQWQALFFKKQTLLVDFEHFYLLCAQLK